MSEEHLIYLKTAYEYIPDLLKCRVKETGLANNFSILTITQSKEDNMAYVIHDNETGRCTRFEVRFDFDEKDQIVNRKDILLFLDIDNMYHEENMRFCNCVAYTHRVGEFVLAGV